MNVLIVSGIWPPDVGGPASHAPEVARFLSSQGHRVEVVVTADAAPAGEVFPVHWVSRRIPVGLRHAATVARVTARARNADVVYTTGMFGRSALGAAVARRPLVVKLTGDPAYERARRFGLFDGSFAEFQRAPSSSTLPLREARDLGLQQARQIICPSAFLRDAVIGWGIPAGRVSVLPNPAPDVAGVRGSGELRAEYGFTGPTLVFAGRLTTQKSLHLAIEAVAAVPGVELVIAGDGPDRASLERRGGARFLGPRSRSEILELFRAADASILSSSWENFPHTVVEALAVGTPVIATRTGGVAEVVEDGLNGLIVEPGDAGLLAAALQRFFADPVLREHLRANAASSVERYAPAQVYGELERILEIAAVH